MGGPAAAAGAWQGRWLTGAEPVRTLCIAGGVHGNEATGLHVARSFATPGAGREWSFELLAVEGNPAAIRRNVRYCETDLNREFAAAALRDAGRAATLEGRRARELDAQLGPKTSPTPRCDLLIDLHNTTAATGYALMMHPSDAFSHEVAAHLRRGDGGVVCCQFASKMDGRILPTIARSGFTLEVGPVAWGVIDPAMYLRTQRLLRAALRYVDAHNRALAAAAPPPRPLTALPAFQSTGTVPFPRDKGGALRGMVHPALAGGDFARPLRKGDPVFLLFAGDEVGWTGEDGAWPFFINEAAYYEGNIAFIVARQKELRVGCLPAELVAARGGPRL